jgi:hypothetical protein
MKSSLWHISGRRSRTGEPSPPCRVESLGTLADAWIQVPEECESPRLMIHFDSVAHAAQTIHIDDLSRNFALNPGEGLKVRLTARSGQRAPCGPLDAGVGC